MTIKKGEAWGEPGTFPSDGVIVDSDRAASRLLEAARLAGREFPVIGMSAGDLCHTLGGRGDLTMTFTVDVGEALIDGRHHYFLAHLTAQEGGRWRRFVVAMNAQWIGDWNFGPRAHPNDGLLDVSEADLQRFEWHKVRARLATGSHLPHPRIKTQRTTAITLEFPKAVAVLVDGEEIDAARVVVLRLLPDALRVFA